MVVTTACAARLVGKSCDGASKDASQAVAEGRQGATTKQPSRCARAASSIVVPASSICASKDASQVVAEGRRGATTKQPSWCARPVSSVVIPSSSICDGTGHSALEPLSGVAVVGLRWRDDRFLQARGAAAPVRMCARVVV